MCKKLFLLMLIGLLGSAYGAAVIVDPILTDDITPTGVFAHLDNGEIWTDSHLLMIDGDLLTNFGFTPAAATDTAVQILFDLGEKKSIGAFKWWNRATQGNLFAENIDLYLFTDDDPTKAPILLDEDLWTDSRQPGNRNNDEIIADVIDITDFYARYVALVFDDGPQAGGNIQGAEIAFRVPEPATMLLLGLGGLALIRKKR